MPLQPYQKSWLLQQQGYDPNTYDVSDDGYIEPRRPTTTVQPAATAGATIAQAKLPAPNGSQPYDAMDTFVKEGIHAAPAAAAAGVGGGAGLGFGLGLAPETGGLSLAIPFITSLIGALGTGAVASGVQGAVEKNFAPKFTAEREAMLQEHPTAGMLGRLAALPVGGFNPNPMNVLRAGSSGIRALTPGALKLTQSELNNLMNVGTGGALGAGMSVGQQVVQGRPLGESLTSADTGEAALGGLLFNSPNALGQRMGFHTPEVNNGIDPVANAEAIRQQRAKAIAQQMIAAEMAKKQGLTPQDRLAAIAASRTPTTEVTGSIPLPQKQVFPPRDLSAEQAIGAQPIIAQNNPYTVGIDASPSGIGQSFNRVGIPERVQQPTTEGRQINPDLEYPELAKLKEQEQAATLERAKAEIQSNIERQNLAKWRAEQLTEVTKSIRENQIKAAPEARPQPLITTETGKEIYGDYTGPTEAENAHNAAPNHIEDLGDAEQKRLEMADEQSLLSKTPSQVELEQKMKEKGLPMDLAAESLAKFAKDSKDRGVDVTANPNLKSKGVTILDRARQALQRVAVEINPNTADISTPGHEGIWHAFAQLMRESPYASDRNLISRGEKLVKDSGIVEQLNAERAKLNPDRIAKGAKPLKPLTTEEFLALEQGYQSVLQHPKLSNEGALKQWYRDTKAHMKHVFGKADLGDVQRLMNLKYHGDVPFEKYFGQHLGNVTGAVQPQNMENETPADHLNFDDANKLINFKSRIEDPTPGSLQAIMKYGNEKSDQLAAQWVAEGRKPIATYKTVEAAKAAIPPNVHNVEVKQMRPTTEQPHRTGAAIIRRGNIEAFNNLMRAHATGNDSTIGKALGYTEPEIQEARSRANQIDIAKQDRRLHLEMSDEQPARKTWSEYGKERRAKNDAELEAIRAGQPVRSKGQAPNTYPQDKEQVASIIAAPKRRVGLDNIVKLDDPETVSVIHNEATKAVKAALNDIRAKIGKFIPLNRADIQDIRSTTMADLLEHGVDRGSTLWQTIVRRAHDAVSAAITEFKRTGRQHTFSFDKPIGETGKTLHDFVTKPEDVNTVAEEMAFADEMQPHEVDTIPAEEQTGPDIASKEPVDLSGLEGLSTHNLPEGKPVKKVTGRKIIKDEPKSVAHYLDTLPILLQETKDKYAEIVAQKGEHDPHAEALQSAIDKAQMTIDTLSKIPDKSAIIDLSSKRLNMDNEKPVDKNLDINEFRKEKSLAHIKQFRAANRQVLDKAIEIRKQIAIKTAELDINPHDLGKAKEVVEAVMEGLDTRPHMVAFVEKNWYKNDTAMMMNDMVHLTQADDVLNELKNISYNAYQENVSDKNLNMANELPVNSEWRQDQKEELDSLYNRQPVDKAKEKFDEMRRVVNNNGKENEGTKAPLLNEMADERAVPLHLLSPEVEKLRKISPLAAETATKFYEQLRSNRGKFEQATMDQIRKARPIDFSDKNWIKEWVMQDNPDYQAVVKYRDLKQDGIDPGFELTPIQQKISDAVDRSNDVTYQARESRPGLERGTGKTPYYLPQAMDRNSIKILTDSPRSPEAAKLKQDFIDYRTDSARGEKQQTSEEAESDWKTIRGQFNLQETGNVAAKFGAVDKATGLGLPISMREQSLIDRMSRYNRRYARRIAYHDTFDTNEAARNEFFNQETGVASTKPGQNILQDVFGIREHNEATRAAAGGLVRSLMLGPLTGAKDIVAGQSLGLQHMGLDQVLPAKLAAIKNFTESWQKGRDTGVIRDNIGSLEMGDGGLTSVQKIMERARDITNVAQGRQLMENVSRALNYGEGRHLALDAFNSMRSGRLTGARRAFLEDFVPDWNKYKEGEVPSEVLDEAAAKFVESVQGKYDYRGLPEIMMKGSFSPVYSLARWNVEKMNNFTSYVVNPALNGNYRPLLMATLGGVLGGAAVTKLVEEVTGRKDKAPSVAEIQASPEKTGLIAYKMAALASMSGYAGFLGDATRSMLDAVHGNKGQTWQNPLLSAMSTSADELGFVIEALQHGDVPRATDLLNMFMSDYVQAWRVGTAQAAKAGLAPDAERNIEDANKRRDLKVFEMGQGIPQARSDTTRANPLLNPDMKQFKRTEDLKEAASLAPGLVKKAVEDAKGNPNTLRANLQELRQNSYQTVPSPTRDPIKFSQYNQFLMQTQGSNAAQQRILDYLSKNAKNRIKSRMIPSF